MRPTADPTAVFHADATDGSRRESSGKPHGRAVDSFLLPFYPTAPGYQNYPSSHRSPTAAPPAYAPGVHVDRVVGGDRHYRDPDRSALARRPEGPRGRRPQQVLQQPQADRPGDARLPRCEQVLPARVLEESTPDPEQLGVGNLDPPLRRAVAPV